MSEQNRDKNGVAENIKEGAGAAFHAIHRGLEATENAAMNAVDQTANAIDEMMDDNNQNG